MSVDFGRPASLCVGSLPSPPDSPSAVKRHTRLEEAVHSCAESLRPAEYTVSDKGCDIVAASTYFPPHARKQCLSNLEALQDHGDSRNTIAEDSQSTNIASMPSDSESSVGTQLLCPNSRLGFSMCNHIPTDHSHREMRLDSLQAPSHQLTKHESHFSEEEEAGSIGSAGDDVGPRMKPSAAQSLAEKRKMKRFRSVYSAHQGFLRECTEPGL